MGAKDVLKENYQAVRRDMIQVVHQVLSEKVGLMVSVTMYENYE